MKVNLNILAGACGFESEVTAVCTDMKQPTKIHVESNCEKITTLGGCIGEVRGLEEISLGFDGVVMTQARNVLKGCCAGCVVPAGIFKAVQVASGLALAKNIVFTMSKEGPADNRNGASCLDCGIAGEDNGISKCYKYGYPVEEAAKIHDGTCRYFIRKIFEDGEPLTPRQHLLMIEQEITSRHMKGPV